MAMRLPALAFIYGGRSAVVWRDQKAYADATGSQLRAGFFRTPFTVIDSELVRWNITDVSLVAVHPLARSLAAVLNRPQSIRLEAKHSGKVDLPAIKAMLSKALGDDPTGIWSGGELSAQEVIDAVQQRSSFEEIVSVLSLPAHAA